MLMTRFAIGTNVAARRDLRSWGSHVRRGSRGTVVSRSGLIEPRYQVDFGRGGPMTVRRRDIRRTMFGSGNDLHAGFRIGIVIFVIVIPGIALARYLLRGGSVEGFVAAMPGAIIAMAAALASRLVTLASVPLILLAVVLYWLLRRVRR
jgi:hypothetical protein